MHHNLTHFPDISDGGSINTLPPPTKLQEGNVFSHVCLSVCPQGERSPHVTITHYALDLSIKGPPWPCPLVVAPGGQDWRPVQTCSQEPHPASDIW